MATEEEDKSAFDLLMAYHEGEKTQAQLKKIVLQLAELLALFPDWPENLDWLTCDAALTYVKSKNREDHELAVFEAHCGDCKFCRQHQKEIFFLVYRQSPQELALLAKMIMNE